MSYGATRHTISNSLSLQAPLTKPPAAWAAPSGDDQELEKRICPPDIWWGFFLIPFDCAGLLIWLQFLYLIIQAQPAALLLLIFLIPWVGFGLFFARMADPGRVWASLLSLSEQLEQTKDMPYLGLLDELRSTAPQISFTGTACHSSLSGDHDDVVTFSETWFIKYSQWRDISGQMRGLEKYPLASLDVHVEVVPADEASEKAIEGMKRSVLQYIENKDRRKSCTVQYHVQDCSWPIHGRRTLMCCTTDDPLPFWMSSTVYFWCSFFCLGTIYRLLFAISAKSVRYNLRKEISISESA